MIDRDAWLMLDGWAGRTGQRVRVVGSTARSWRIRAIATTRLAGSGRVLSAGAVAWVPRYAIRFIGPP